MIVTACSFCCIRGTCPLPAGRMAVIDAPHKAVRLRQPSVSFTVLGSDVWVAPYGVKVIEGVALVSEAEEVFRARKQLLREASLFTLETEGTNAPDEFSDFPVSR